MDLEKFRMNYPLDEKYGRKESESLANEHKRWHDITDVERTPTVFIRAVKF